MSSRQSISAEHQAIIDEEIALHERVKNAVRDAALAQRGQLSKAYARGITDLREQAASAHAHDLPALFDQLHSSQMLAQRTHNTVLPDMRAPYFARLRIIDDGASTPRDVLIGHETFISATDDVYIIDWKNAPLAKAYFNSKEGDTYTIDVNENRQLRGKLLLRHTLQFEMGKLTGISTPNIELRRDLDSWYVEENAQAVSLAGGEGQAMRSFGSGQTGRAAMDVAALLDEHQFRILQKETDAPLLVLGGAGSGKTTVALHRIASLFARDPHFFAQHKMLVLVPEPGLVRLSRKLLLSLRLERVLVATFDQWLYEQARHVIPSCAKRLYQSTPPRIMRLKRHPAVFSVFPELARLKQEKFVRIIQKKLVFIPDAVERFRSMQAKNLAEKIEAFFLDMQNEVPRAAQRDERAVQGNAEGALDDSRRRSAYEKTLKEVHEQLRRELVDLSADRIELFTNKELLATIISRGRPQLDDMMIREVTQHTNDQITAPEGPRMRDIDPEYAKALDEQDVDTEDEDEIYNSVDVDDLTVLLELLRFYTGRLGSLTNAVHTYSHIVLDEAQELAPTELRLLGHLLEPKGSITIAGDAVQQTDPTSVFAGWEESLKALGVAYVKPEQLKTSYRCPAPIMTFSYDVLGALAPSERPIAKRPGKPVMVSKASSEGHANAMMLEVLDDLLQKEPRASIAIIASDFETAKQVYKGLTELPNIRLIRDGAFDFKPGIDVADVTQVKGLEFDYVIIPDCDTYRYPDTPEHRRLLHVAATRAIHQLWVITVKVPSHLIPKSALKDMHNFYGA